jgi:hypothetical protein
MGRPVGVTILAILDFLGGLFCLFGGIGMIAGGGFMATILSQQGQGSAGFLAGLGALAGVVLLAFAVLDFLLGWGLWKLKNWARMITVVFTAFGAVLQVISLVGLLAHFNVFAFVWTLFVLAIEVLIIWYLLKADVKAAFTQGQAGAAAA